MMTKDEIKALIAETMRSNNKKEITAQAIADIFYEVVDAMGEGSGGGENSVMKLWFNMDEDYELTEQQIEDNKRVFASIAAKECPIVTLMLPIVEGTYFTCLSVTIYQTVYMPETNDIILVVQTEEGAMTFYLFENGTVEIDVNE